MQPLRIGFIGAGAMATWAIYPALYFAPIELVAVCDIDTKRAVSAAKKFGAERWYTDYQTMLQREKLEAVIVQMHPRPRQQIVLDALATGHHVLVPKPPAISLAATVELANAAQQAGRVLMVNFQRRFSKGVTAAHAAMQTASFGHLTQFHGSFCSGAYDAVRGADYDGPVHAYLLDFMVHHLDLARFFAGEVKNLALYHQVIDGGISLALSLQFEQGTVGTLQFNSQRIWWRNYDRIELTGQGEYLILDGIWSMRRYAAEQNTFTENYSDERSIELTGDGPVLVEFVAAIREGREPIATIADARYSMQLYQTIYAAVVAGQQGTIPLLPIPT